MLARGTAAATGAPAGARLTMYTCCFLDNMRTSSLARCLKGAASLRDGEHTGKENTGRRLSGGRGAAGGLPLPGGVARLRERLLAAPWDRRARCGVVPPALPAELPRGLTHHRREVQPARDEFARGPRAHLLATRGVRDRAQGHLAVPARAGRGPP